MIYSYMTRFRCRVEEIDQERRGRGESDDILETTLRQSVDFRSTDIRSGSMFFPSRGRVIYLIAKPTRHKYHSRRSASIFLLVNMRLRRREKSHRENALSGFIFPHPLPPFLCSCFVTPPARKPFARECNSASVPVIKRARIFTRIWTSLSRVRQNWDYIFYFGVHFVRLPLGTPCVNVFSIFFRKIHIAYWSYVRNFVCGHSRIYFIFILFLCDLFERRK